MGVPKENGVLVLAGADVVGVPKENGAGTVAADAGVDEDCALNENGFWLAGGPGGVAGGAPNEKGLLLASVDVDVEIGGVPNVNFASVGFTVDVLAAALAVPLIDGGANENNADFGASVVEVDATCLSVGGGAIFSLLATPEGAVNVNAEGLGVGAFVGSVNLVGNRPPVVCEGVPNSVDTAGTFVFAEPFDAPKETDVAALPVSAGLGGMAPNKGALPLAEPFWVEEVAFAPSAVPCAVVGGQGGALPKPRGDSLGSVGLDCSELVFGAKKLNPVVPDFETDSPAETSPFLTGSPRELSISSTDFGVGCAENSDPELDSWGRGVLFASNAELAKKLGTPLGVPVEDTEAPALDVGLLTEAGGTPKLKILDGACTGADKVGIWAGGVDVADFRVFSVGIGVSFTCSGVFPKLVPVNNGATGGFSLGTSICFPFSPVLTGFANENGNEVIGGSLALLRSCSIVVD